MNTISMEFNIFHSLSLKKFQDCENVPFFRTQFNYLDFYLIKTYSVLIHLHQKGFTFLLYESFDIVPVMFMKLILLVVGKTKSKTAYLLMMAKLNPIIDLIYAFFYSMLTQG